MRGWRGFVLCGLVVSQIACSRGEGLELTPVFLPSSDLTRPPTIGWMLAARAGEHAPARAAAPSSDAFLRLEGQFLALDRRFLNTPFVLLPALTESTVSPEPLLWMSTSLVAFQHLNGALQLVETAQGKQGHTTNRTPQILATFPILRATPREILFDFQAGALSDLFLVRRPPLAHATDVNQAMLHAPPWTIMSGSYIRSAHAGEGWFSLVQVVSFSNAHVDVGAVFRFTFWRADHSTIEPLRDDPEDDIGYFHIERFTPGHPEPHYTARRWNPERPLTLYLSANTPTRFRGAIREGVLAWNAVFGREFLQVADAPAGVTAGDPRYPLIQWVEHLSGLGIGMSQSHPVTGEQLTALITIREGWATLNDVDHFRGADDASPTEALPFTLNGFTPAVQCERDAMGWDDGWHRHDLAKGGPPVVEPLDSATRDRLARLQLRAVVMHEVGHVLGLRHNFAGNLDSAIDPADESDDLAAAMAGARAADAPLPSSSIMDYLTTPDDIRMTTPGRYDAAAIAWAYGTPESAPLSDVHFCTDEHVGQIADCARRDSGGEPLDWWSRELEVLAHAYSRWLLDHVALPPDQMNPQQGVDEGQAWLLKRIGRAFEALRGYTGRFTKSWVIDGHFLVERAPIAAALVAAYFEAGPKIGIPVGARARPPSAPTGSLRDHPFVRSPLTEKIRELESLATGSDPQAAWAAQVLQDLAAELSRISGVYGYPVQ